MSVDAERILDRMRLQLERASDPYRPPEERLGALVTLSADATLVATRLAGYPGEFVYLGPQRTSVASKKG